jgi:hypothetical protein
VAFESVTESLRPYPSIGNCEVEAGLFMDDVRTTAAAAGLGVDRARVGISGLQGVGDWEFIDRRDWIKE